MTLSLSLRRFDLSLSLSPCNKTSYLVWVPLEFGKLPSGVEFEIQTFQNVCPIHVVLVNIFSIFTHIWKKKLLLKLYGISPKHNQICFDFG